MPKMPKPTSETFDYSREYSLVTLAKVFACNWNDVPENSNGIIDSNQQVMVTLVGRERYDVDEIINLSWRGRYVYFGDTAKNMSIHSEIFKIIPNELILNIEGI